MLPGTGSVSTFGKVGEVLNRKTRIKEYKKFNLLE